MNMETKAERVRRYWTAKANKSDVERKIWEERYKAQRAITAKLRAELDRQRAAHQDSIAALHVGIANAQAKQKEAERINQSYENSLEDDSTTIVELTGELADLRRSNYKLICILDNVTHPERGKS